MKKKNINLFFYLIILMPSLIFLQCVTNPVTKEKDFILISEAQEISMGVSADKEVLDTYGLYSDQKLQNYIDEIGQKVAGVSDRKNIKFFFTVVDSTEINAFALPGGYIYITRGILALLNSEAELAGVLGHEIGHVCARHSAKQISQAIGYQVLMTGASIALPQLSQWGQISDIIFGTIENGFGRQYELQSDELGQNYEFRAGYDPLQAASFLTTLKKTEKGTGVFHGLFATHPETENRIKQAIIHGNKLKSTTTAQLQILDDKYISMLQGLVYGRGEKEGIVSGNSYKNRAYRFAISLPAGWDNTIKNGKLFSKDPENILNIELEQINRREGLTSVQLAEKWEGKTHLKRFQNEPYSKNGLDGYICYYDAKSEKTPLRLKVLFFVKNGSGFALICYSPAKDFRFALDDFNKTIYSLRNLSDNETEGLKAKHLNIYTVKEGDNFNKIAEKELGDGKKAEELATLNGLEVNSQLRVGKKLKLPSY
ncbi:MAG: hypothetical protein A3C43_03935 [Candidatus Schekmanbacteria bacterium RIFCSPHIGHO2_02_FULL_38_11]|uniref:LysM domain-containing protein n=1 Tax=Candidatus Schekmanbacteria bacterium RIFCSPLOWO2_12_FULL_38_15 TaxID=1817883 RepID=A0A1F7SH45_9BACT|nr:MAG: hypothetical protein A2043_04450 [Candidatus Schekmanbacteria bacterium GWA2_38_9]OGL49711.1 MAG: hypothetical protein A3H37_01630 [Candidatus Schekmanbacteria bacterium RIFCSPLOWO2_02_FULL_38_14]OGL53065.1 MAG: hypothetical protein A3G31_09185 [Candidatus Schekmanbacteria bacterium RIFCSPLOWO2_12_FULL_38_15]OGL53768.1 MAG: hypothetical protein A3C43_03935 [Candidatus Schekmanbacteria bacterium RIFCSPHIGHO2_02_FULL_38_11]